MRPVQLVEVDPAVIECIQHLACRHDREIKIGSAFSGMRPNPFFAGPVVIAEPHGP
jgi:hypothetical protein